MSGKNYTAMLGLGLLLAQSGCVSCGHDVCMPVLEAGPYAEAPIGDRRHVHVFLINGLTPSGPSGLEGLRMKLAERGYEKVYRGGLSQTRWMWREMKHVHACDPEARFVLVGYGFGCGPAAALAQDASCEGIPVDAVVLLDPVGMKGTCSDATRSVVIRSGAVPECGHFTLPTHETTVDAIAVVLSEAAARVEHPPVADDASSWYEDAPPPRAEPTISANTPEEWLFLHDRLGPHTLPLSPLPGYSYPDASGGIIR